MLFADRHDAGRKLAERLSRGRSPPGNTVVLGLARGGLPVAAEIARALGAPLDVLIVRKIGVPGHDEYAMGAIASGGVRVENYEIMRALGIGGDAFERVAVREQAELERRERLYRGDRPPIPLSGADVILVDDGIATGASMLAAVTAAKHAGARSITVAAPLIGSDAAARLVAAADDVIALDSLDELGSVGAGYVDFAQTTDDEVRALLSGRPTPVTS